MWKRLADQLIRKSGHDLVRPPKEKIDSALKKYEEEIGVSLPEGYKAFIREFGPGEIGAFRVFGPKISKFRDCGNDIAEENQNWRDPEGYWATSGKPALVARLICFSTSIGGDACFWDPDDVRDPKNHEYGIYVLPQSGADGKVTCVAGSFKEFVESVCLGHGFDKIGGGWGEEGSPPQRFLPAWKTKRT